MLQQQDRQREGIVADATRHSTETGRAYTEDEAFDAARSGVYENISGQIRTPDGYLRRSPEQPIQVDPKYKLRLIKRGVAAVVILTLAVTALYILMRYLTFH